MKLVFYLIIILLSQKLRQTLRLMKTRTKPTLFLCVFLCVFAKFVQKSTNLSYKTGHQVMQGSGECFQFPIILRVVLKRCCEICAKYLESHMKNHRNKKMHWCQQKGTTQVNISCWEVLGVLEVIQAFQNYNQDGFLLIYIYDLFLGSV